MSLIVLYLGTRYAVCKCYSLRDMTISLFFVTFDLCLWPLSSVKVTFIFIIRWTLCSCVLVPTMKFVGSIELKCGQLFGENLNDVTMMSSPIRFLWDLNTKRPRVYLSYMLNSNLIKHKIAEIQSRKVNRELWRKNGHFITVTLTFDRMVTNFHRNRATAVSNHLAKTPSKSVHPFG